MADKVSLNICYVLVVLVLYVPINLSNMFQFVKLQHKTKSRLIVSWGAFLLNSMNIFNHHYFSW